MPAHESPPPTARIDDPVPLSRPSTPDSSPSRSRRVSYDVPSRVASQLGLEPEPKTTVDADTPKTPNAAAFAGSIVDRLLAHRWNSWIAPRLKWPLLKPVIRCAIAVSSKYHCCNFTPLTNPRLGLAGSSNSFIPVKLPLGKLLVSHPSKPIRAKSSLCPYCRLYPAAASTCCTVF